MSAYKVENENSKRRFSLDFIVICSLILISLLILLFVFLFRKPGSYATVEVDGTVIGEYSLLQSGTFVLNGGTNTLVIDNGEVYLINSHCPDHTCERTGKIHYVGQTIVCLPNKLSVTIKGESKDGVDFVS